MKRPFVSIVIPVNNEADNIKSLADEITSAMTRAGLEWECIWVNDGSRDSTPLVLKELCSTNPYHRAFDLVERSGISAALFAGFSLCRGAVVATLDGDGQNDPADLPAFVELLSTGDAHMVQGYRETREDNRLRRLSSLIANGVRNFMLEGTVRDTGCATRIFKKQCIEVLPLFSGVHRYFPDLMRIYGYRVIEAPARHRPRLSGKTKFGVMNRLWVGIIDCFGVLWIKKRAFRRDVIEQSRDEKKEII